MNKRIGLVLSVLAIFGLTFGLSYMDKAAASAPGVNKLISDHVSGTWTDGASYMGLPQSVSGDGRYVAFSSDASNLVASDTNGIKDVFVRDTQTGTTTLVDVSTAGVQADAYAEYPAMSYDGRYVVFQSPADNLVSGITGTTITHVYLRDLVSQTTTLVDTSSAGDVGVSNASGASVSADGRFVAFGSQATNLVSGFSTHNYYQVYVKDMSTGGIKPLSVSSAGSGGDNTSATTSISCDGNVVAFTSQATNLPGGRSGPTDLYLAVVGWEGTQLTNVTGASAYGMTGIPQLSCNGNVVVYASDSTDVISPPTVLGYENIYEYNRLTGVQTLVSLGNNNIPDQGFSKGLHVTASVSDDGRFVAFAAEATGLDPNYTDVNAGPFYDIYVRDVKNSTTELATITAAGYKSGELPVGTLVSISPDGSYVAFLFDTPSTGSPGRALISGMTTGSSSLAQQDIYEAETGF